MNGRRNGKAGKYSFLTQIDNVYKLQTDYTLFKEAKMRTNIVVDDNLMAEALKLSNIKTKRGVVDKALKLLVQVKKQEAIRELRGKLNWQGNLSEMRID
ncbi:MAG: type II toxin-antitoxin system VapB family antitoxin [Thermodesulfobacteriota bacterium]|nr:type II toxin-antitoxin system VapB family antitoxin [Thermodesulfobacteriota bacterium]